MKILADASLPDLTKFFPSPFEITTYDSERNLFNAYHTDVLLCRSTLKVDENLLRRLGVKVVATASSGIDHIDQAALKKLNVFLFDAKGANAESVADYVIASTAFLMKKGLLTGNKVGIIGVGAVGSEVYRRLKAFNFILSGYDPFKTSSTNISLCHQLTDLLDSDLLCVHANLHFDSPFPSYNLLDKNILSQLKEGTCIINAARGGIVNEAELLQLRRRINYCTDVFLNEPNISPEVTQFAKLCTPHIAGHTVEAKINAVRIVSEKIHHFFHLPIAPVPPQAPTLSVYDQTNWQQSALLMYNPEFETIKLKKNLGDIAVIFQKLRQNHRRYQFLSPNRHI